LADGGSIQIQIRFNADPEENTDFAYVAASIFVFSACMFLIRTRGSVAACGDDVASLAWTVENELLVAEVPSV